MNTKFFFQNYYEVIVKRRMVQCRLNRQLNNSLKMLQKLKNVTHIVLLDSFEQKIKSNQIASLFSIKGKMPYSTQYKNLKQNKR